MPNIRGESGKFITNKEAENVTSEDLPQLVHKSTKMSGALNDLKEEAENAEFDKPLVSVSVNNPVSWFQKLLNNLKKKQTTTFTFRLGVPLIALPVLIAAFAGVFFGLGKVTNKSEVEIVPTPTPIVESFVTKTGTLKNISKSGGEEYYLILSDGSAIMVVADEIKLSELEGKRILVSGKYNSKDNVLTVEKVADLEILPITPKPLPTEILIETPTPTEVLPTVTPSLNE